MPNTPETAARLADEFALKLAGAWSLEARSVEPGRAYREIIDFVKDNQTAILSALRCAQGFVWRPIETARRDGTRILAIGGGLGEEAQVVSYLERVGAWDADSVTLDDVDYEPDGYNRPTHWQPLPPPPHIDRNAAQECGA